jgi:hypothetical protein
MRLKVFMIVGYPWETPESVKEDILKLRDTLSRVKPGRGRVMMMITTTPFSPEPLTAMENEAANIDVNWREILLDDAYRCIYDSQHLNAFFLPQIPGPLSLFKRVVANRAGRIDHLRAAYAAKTLDEAVAACGDVHRAGAGTRVSKLLYVGDRPSVQPAYKRPPSAYKTKRI